MSGVHLTPELWRRLCVGERGADAARLAAHLREPCEACEVAIAAAGSDPFDGAVDLTLASLGPGRAGNDLEFERIRRRLARPSRRVALGAAAAGVFVLVGTAVIARVAWPPTQGTGEKGEGVQGEVEVSFVVATPAAGAQPRLEKGVPGRSYPCDRDVLVRYRTTQPGFATVIRLGADGSVDVLAHGVRVDAGEHDVGAEGTPAGYRLAGLTGRQRFAVLVAAQPMPVRDLLALAQGGSIGAAGAVARAAVELDVVPAP